MIGTYFRSEIIRILIVIITLLFAVPFLALQLSLVGKLMSIVSDEIIVGLVKERISEDDCSEGFLFDGFPRTIIQANELEDLFKYHQMNLDLIIELKVDERALMSRIIKRAEESVEKRADDNSDIVKKRLEVYNKETKPIICLLYTSDAADE